MDERRSDDIFNFRQVGVLSFSFLYASQINNLSR